MTWEDETITRLFRHTFSNTFSSFVLQGDFKEVGHSLEDQVLARLGLIKKLEQLVV